LDAGHWVINCSLGKKSDEKMDGKNFYESARLVLSQFQIFFYLSFIQTLCAWQVDLRCPKVCWGRRQNFNTMSLPLGVTEAP
jgi:hypothetical protein